MGLRSARVDFYSGLANPLGYAYYRGRYVRSQPANVHVYLDYAYYESDFAVPSVEVFNRSESAIGISSVVIDYMFTGNVITPGRLVESGEGLWVDLRHPYSSPFATSSYTAPRFEDATVTIGIVTEFAPIHVRFLVEER